MSEAERSERDLIAIDNAIRLYATTEIQILKRRPVVVEGSGAWVYAKVWVPKEAMDESDRY